MGRAQGFRQLLEAGDVRGLMRAWHRVMPDMPKPRNAEAGEITMHMARTAAESISLKARCYSHRWLCERSLPSSLPDELKPSADRLYPRVAEAVGISVNFRSPLLASAAAEVRGAMEDAVNECYADGKTQVPFVQDRMAEAKDRTLRALFG